MDLKDASEDREMISPLSPLPQCHVSLIDPNPHAHTNSTMLNEAEQANSRLEMVIRGFLPSHLQSFTFIFSETREEYE